MTKRKWTKGRTNDLQNITQKIKDRATRTPLKWWVMGIESIFQQCRLYRDCQFYW